MSGKKKGKAEEGTNSFKTRLINYSYIEFVLMDVLRTHGGTEVQSNK
jgi:hypothetical protein